MIQMTLFLMGIFCIGGLFSKMDYTRQPRPINDEKEMKRYRKLFNIK